MDRETLQKQVKRLRSRAPLVGAVLRRRACRALARERSAECIPYLVEALSSEDPRVMSTAYGALCDLQDEKAVDALCAQWVRKRHPRLARIIAERKYVARSPAKVRVLSALQAGRLEVAGESAEGARCLVEALQGKDSTIAARAQEALGMLREPKAVEALCEAVIAQPASPAAAIVKEKGYAPQDVGRRCLLFLLTGQIEKYFELDYDFQYLRAEYRAADQTLRQRIGEVIRTSGDQRLLGLFRSVRKLAIELTEQEAGVLLDVYARNRQWEEIFRVLPDLPVVSALRGIRLLAEAGWSPARPELQGHWQEVVRLAQGMPAELSSVPEPEATFGPVLGKWISQGFGPEHQGRSLDELRRAFRKGDPPQAVAALAALTRKAQNVDELVQQASSHRHWLVRLASLALCETDPVVVMAQVPLKGAGGELWLERMALYAGERSLRGARPVSLTPDQLEAIKARAAQMPESDPRKRWGELLCALSPARLALDVEELRAREVEIEATAIEIE